MGASGWHYFTPYRESAGDALEELRQRVFRAREYGDPALKPFNLRPGEMEGLTPAQRKHMEELLAQQAKAIEALDDARGHPAEPETIEQLLAESGESGTHSIIDIGAISDQPDFGAAYPMPEAMKQTLYGTTQPTHEQVEAKVHECGEELDRWQAWYVVVYKDGEPDEIYFEGCSGD